MLSNIDLTRFANKSRIKLDGICYKDELQFIKKKANMNIIINLQDSTGLNNGTHWVCLLKRNNNYLYFDSFGCIPDIAIRNYCDGKLGYSNYICQNINSQMCGYFCFGLIHYVTKNKGNLYDLSNEYINLFEDNTKLNDDILQKYIQKYNIE